MRSCEFLLVMSSFNSLLRDRVCVPDTVLSLRSCAGILRVPRQGPCSNILWVPFKISLCKDLVNSLEEFVYKNSACTQNKMLVKL